jgi:predicted RNase H-like nuclease
VLKLGLKSNLLYIVMSRNNEKNIKKHNDKLHKAQDRLKQAEISRKEKLKQILKKYNDTNASETK